MSDKVPKWAIEMAREVGVAGHLPTVHLRIASALLSAYRRGVEDSAQISDEKARSYERETWPSSGNSEQDKTFSRSVAVRLIGLSAAIRRLGEAE